LVTTKDSSPHASKTGSNLARVRSNRPAAARATAIRHVSVAHLTHRCLTNLRVAARVADGVLTITTQGPARAVLLGGPVGKPATVEQLGASRRVGGRVFARRLAAREAGSVTVA